MTDQVSPHSPAEDDERLSAYLDDELDPADRAEVEALLAASPAHRQVVDDLAFTRALVRGLGPVTGDLPAILSPGGSSDADVVPIRRPRRTAASAAPPRSRASRTRRLGAAVMAVAAVWLLVLTFGAGIDRLPVVPDVDQLAVRHAQADQLDGFVEMPGTDELPTSLGAGMQQVGVYQQGELVQVRYSDGEAAISVFHEPGEVNWDELPADGEMMKMEGEAAWHGYRDDMDVFVVERGDKVVTVVADADMAEMAMDAPMMMPDDEPDNGLMARTKRGFGELLDRVSW